MAEQRDTMPVTRQTPEQEALVTYVNHHVDIGRQERDKNLPRWKEYYRLWRGIWDAEDKTRNSERSKLISPATQQAIEVAVAELEEATFGKGRWFDVSDDLMDQDPADMEVIRKLLAEDLEKHCIRSVISEVYLNAAIYGTGIGKIAVDVEKEVTLASEPVSAGSRLQRVSSTEQNQVAVKLRPVSPFNFIIDPAATCIDDAMYCAEEMEIPKHKVVEKQLNGIYKDITIGGYSQDTTDIADDAPTSTENFVKITEFHGLVPERLLIPEELEPDEELVELMPQESVDMDFDIEEENMVEAIVTISNNRTLLRAVRNPVIKQDRAFIAFPFERIPDSFWGRGVAEKGYNVQKALDAELRGRIDAMALTIHPMMAVDATRLVRGGDLSVKPGRNILTQGDPNQILRPLNFGQVSNQTFTQSGELERMIQMATGSMDSAAPIGVSPRNATASGMSMMLSGAIKRSKRTLMNIEKFFIAPLIHKSAWRYMQFDPDRYPIKDVKFTVHATLGMMAREFEQAQLTQLLNTVPPDSPAYWMLIRSVYENSSISNKEEMLQLVNQMLQQVLNPPEPQPDPEILLKQQKMQIDAELQQQRIQIEQGRLQVEVGRLELAVQQAPSEVAANEAKAMLDIAKAQAEESSQRLEFIKLQIDALKPNLGEFNVNRAAAEGV